MKRIQKRILIAAAICFIFAGILFYYNNLIIPGIMKDVEADVRLEIDENSMPKMRVAIVVPNENISQSTELTDEIINQKIKLVEIPKKYVAAGVVTDLEEIRGMIAKEDLRPGEQLVKEGLANGDKWFDTYQRLKEYEVSSIVADEVKSGNLVDIVVSYENGDYDVVVPKTKVIKLVSTEANKKNSKQTDQIETEINARYTLILAVDEIEYRDLALAKQLGSLETRLYLDENQPASPKTFQYEKVASVKNIDAKIANNLKPIDGNENKITLAE